MLEDLLAELSPGVRHFRDEVFLHLLLIGGLRDNKLEGLVVLWVLVLFKDRFEAPLMVELELDAKIDGLERMRGEGVHLETWRPGPSVA